MEIYHIACKNWTTTKGKVILLSFKFEGDDGSIIMVTSIQILYTEDKNFSEIPSREFVCEAIIGGLFETFRLILYCERCKWVMVI